MTQNLGWIKQQRSLLYSFSDDKKLNSELWLLYHYLVQIAAYDDMREVCRGQIKTQIIQIIRDYFPHWYKMKMARRLYYLEKLGYIKLTPLGADGDGFLIEICQYDELYGKNDQNECYRSVTEVLPKCDREKETKVSESLDKNHVNITQCDRSVTEVLPECYRSGCSYIEEKNKELRIKNLNLDEGVNPSPRIETQIIKDEPKKKKEVGKSVELIKAYENAYFQRYQVKPLINAKVRGQAINLIDRVGKENAITMIYFYLTHNGTRYLSNAHALGYCLMDAEKLHTEMLKKDYIFSSDVKKLESTSANSALLGRLYNQVEKE